MVVSVARPRPLRGTAHKTRVNGINSKIVLYTQTFAFS